MLEKDVGENTVRIIKTSVVILEVCMTIIGFTESFEDPNSNRYAYSLEVR